MEQTADRPVRPGGSPAAPDPPTAPDATAGLTLAGDAASTGAPATPADAAVLPEGAALTEPSPDTPTLHAWHFQADHEPTPDPLAVTATLAPWHRPRLVAHPAHTYVSVTVATLDPAARRVEARQLDLF